MNKLEKFSRIAGILGFIFSILIGYNLYLSGPSLSIQGLPIGDTITYINTHRSEPIEFSFHLYNSGSTTAFVNHIFIYEVTSGGQEPLFSGYEVNPRENFYIESKKTETINIKLLAPESSVTKEFIIDVVYEPKWLLLFLNHARSKKYIAQWSNY